MDSVLIDSDVCLDFLTGRRPWSDDANQIFDACESGRVSGYITGLSFSNMFYLLRKQYGAVNTISRLSELRNILNISPITSSGVDWALSSEWSDFEDALQYQSAVDSRCEAVVSRNLSDYQKAARIPVFSPTEFISKHLQ